MQCVNAHTRALAIRPPMARRPPESPAAVSHATALLLLALAACSILYTGLALARRRSASLLLLPAQEAEPEECCGGLKYTELWGEAVKWGTDLRFNTSRECCGACRKLCSAGDGPCLCNSWVFCGDRDRCADRFGECWLKKQKDVLAPEVHQSGEQVLWTSGLIFGKGEGIVGLETEHGTLHMKLFPDCAPHSVSYVLELLGYRYCSGCQFYRAENRGRSWDADGNHIDDTSFGPPYGLLQGSLAAEGIPFKDIPKESCPKISRGSVAWVGSGPDFFISLANHNEWRRAHTVFASIFLPEDMALVEKLSYLPTTPNIMDGVNVSLLVKPIDLKIRRLTSGDPWFH